MEKCQPGKQTVPGGKKVRGRAPEVIPGLTKKYDWDKVNKEG